MNQDIIWYRDRNPNTGMTIWKQKRIPSYASAMYRGGNHLNAKKVSENSHGFNGFSTSQLDLSFKSNGGYGGGEGLANTESLALLH